MSQKEPTSPTLRRPLLKALRSRVGRLLRMAAGKQKLEMRTLETERLILRAFDQGDLKDIAGWPEIAESHNSEEQAQKVLDYCFREYRERGIGPWAMELRKTKTAVGSCGFPHITFNHRCGEINYYVARTHRGQDLATEAVRALLEFGFHNIGLKRIQARCDESNVISQGLAQKVGMKLCGIIEGSKAAGESSPRQKMYVILSKDFHDLPAGSRSNEIEVTAKPIVRS